MSDIITNTTSTNDSKIFNVYVSKSTTAGTALVTRGSLNKTDTAPTVAGLYILKETGVYTNLGGINAQSGKLNFASFDGTTWSLIAVDAPTPITNNYITENTYNLDPNQIVPSEALYNDATSTLAGDVLKRVDINTGEDVNYRETTTWHDGSAMDDSRVDGFVYKKIGIKYYERIFGNIINVLDCGAIADDITNTSTKAINLAVKVAGTTKTVYIPSGSFWIKAHDENQPEGYPTYDRGIMCQEGTKIKMESDTYLKTIPNGKRHYSIISIFGKNNISIEGGNLVGERYEHIGTEENGEMEYWFLEETT